MASRLDELMERMALLERELEYELNRARAEWQYRIVAGRIRFERQAHLAHKRFKQRILTFLRESSIPNALTTPLIFSLIVPVAILDFWITAYQLTCFPVYGIARVRRSAYIVIDRQHLAYLNGIEKLNCVYCGYANGVLAYVREIAARTEEYWCPIRHAKRVRAPHSHYHEFVDYGDAEGYRRQLPVLRKALEKEHADDLEAGRGGRHS